MNFFRHHPRRTAWTTVIVFAIAMAWVESAVVFDLRTHVDRIEPYQPDPLPTVGVLGPIELVRELATLVMLFTVGRLAGTTWRSRVGYMFIAFGVWDICYYVFLKAMCDWPRTLMDWDLLFLLPLPWWGPVLAPVLIATLMILWGTSAVFFEQKVNCKWSNRRGWICSLIGGALALFVFMTDTLKVADQGVPAIRKVLPIYFNWPLFSIALLLMSVPVIAELSRWRNQRESAQTQK